MELQNDTYANQGNSNIPTSLDITELLSKLDSLQSTSDASAKRRNIRLIELDPYHHEDEQRHTKTRIFMAAAFGTQAVVVQIFALELTKIEESEDGDEEYEWVDVSEKRIVDRYDSDKHNRPVLIYPPCCADSLPRDRKSSRGRIILPEEIKGVEITSCMLIPAPAIRINSPRAAVNDGEQDRILTQRTVAAVIGTSRGSVFSVLLRVIEEISESTEQDNFHFTLGYEKCKSLGGEEIGKQFDSDASIPKQPVLYQVFPQSRAFDEEQFLESIQEGPLFLGETEAHIRVIHPSKPLHLKNVTEMNCISSITFGRGNWKLCRKRRKKRGQTVMSKDDNVWISYTNGSMVMVPSWKLFFSIDSDGQRDYISKRAVSEGDRSAGNPLQRTDVFPINNPFPSPLDVPPPQSNHPNSSGFINRDIDFDEQSITSKMSMASKWSIGTSYSQLTVSCDQDYWGLLSTVVTSLAHSAQNAGAQQNSQPLQALVLGSQSAPGSSVPFSVHSSRVECSQESSGENRGEDEANEGANIPVGDDKSWASSSDDDHYGLVTGTVVGGTAALVRGALGAALGAVRWGFGGGAAVDDIDLDHESFDNADDSLDVVDSVEEESHENDRDQFDISNSHGLKDPITKKKGETLDLLPFPLCSTSLMYSDVPRRFENAVVEPSSSLVATTDNLGRVILIDLETQQPIRMWKGMRNVSLHFAELPCEHLLVGKSVRSKLYLIIHGYKRGTVEIYRLRQGPRIAAASVPNKDRCSIVESFGPPSEDSRVSCFLFEQITDDYQSKSGSNCQRSILDYIVIDDGNNALNENNHQRMQQPAPAIRNSMQLNFLIQLLASDTNIQCNSDTILHTFKSIQALSDLGEGLDAMSKSQKMEQIGTEGSSIRSRALSHCKVRLEKALEKENREGSGLLQKTVILEISCKISYHEKLASAYDVLHRYEIKTERENEDDDADAGGSHSLSEWASEAISWISVAEEHGIFSTTTNRREDLSKPLAFSKFATACSPPTPKTRGQKSHSGVYLIEVKRDRQPILMRIFRPLLEDLFVFKVVNSIFSSLGIEEDFHIQQQYFGEWFASISSYDIAQSNLSGAWRPMFRWIQDLIVCAFDVHLKHPSEFDEVQLKNVCHLQSLLDFCMQMEDLTKAFLLAVICMDAVSVASKQIEEKTYGKITALECVQPWEILLRKLRVLLLVTFRLSGDVNAVGIGVNPLTLKSVTEFSTYYWVARDELSLSHDNQGVCTDQCVILISQVHTLIKLTSFLSISSSFGIGKCMSIKFSGILSIVLSWR